MIGFEGIRAPGVLARPRVIRLLSGHPPRFAFDDDLRNAWRRPTLPPPYAALRCFLRPYQPTALNTPRQARGRLARPILRSHDRLGTARCSCARILSIMLAAAAGVTLALLTSKPKG